jgi:hypothetical protein
MEIKARAWDYTSQQMIYGVGISEDGKAIMPGYQYFTQPHLLSPPMLYTGVKDIYSVGIYEGDIVTRGGGNFKVVYKNDKYYTGFVATANDECSKYIHLWYNGIKVIDTIYNNPEALEEVCNNEGI